MISLAELQKHARTGESADDDTVLTTLEEAAVAAVEKYTDRYFGAVESTTEYLDGAGHRTLWLTDTPSTDPTTATERLHPGDTGTTITAADDDGFLVRGRKLIRKGGWVWSPAYEYEVTYSRGYAAGSEPDDIRQAVRDLVVWWFEQRIPAALGSVAPEVPWHLREILDPWRNVPV